jgi:hypothetical protein
VKDGCPFLASSFRHVKEEDNNSKCFINDKFIFACPKTNQQRSGEKGSRSLGPAICGTYPVLLKITGCCGTRGVYAPQGCTDSPRAIPVIFVGI